MAPLSLTGPLADRDAWSAAGVCSLGRALDVLGTRSSLLLLREAAYGTTRFDDFARRVGLGDAATSARLRELVADELLERVPYRDPGQRTREGYELTERGRDLVVALAALMQWGDRWLQPDGAPVALRHADCGAPVRIEARCADGHAVGPDELEVELGPGARRRRQA